MQVYTFGAEGMLTCLDLLDGKRFGKWTQKRSFTRERVSLEWRVLPWRKGATCSWTLAGVVGQGSSPLIKDQEKISWKCANDEAGYASPVAATIHDKRYAFFFTRAGLVAANPADGKVQFQFHWRSRENASVNAATPVIIDDMIFLSACYGTGAGFAEVCRTTAWKSSGLA